MYRNVELTKVTTMEIKIEKKKSFLSKGECENRQNCEWRGIKNALTITKFANFGNFKFSKLKKNRIFKKNSRFKILKIC